MEENRLHKFADIVQLAQAAIQKDFTDINPLISLSSHLRSHGFAADILTIDEPLTKKRIMMVLHDEKPEQIDYQLSFTDSDPAADFLEVAQKALTEEKLYVMIKEYFV